MGWELLSISPRLIGRPDNACRRRRMSAFRSDIRCSIVEVIRGLHLSAMCRSYRGRRIGSCHPALLSGILVYGYATGMFSSRKLERATYDSVAFRLVAVTSRGRFPTSIRQDPSSRQGTLRAGGAEHKAKLVAREAKGRRRP
jgi:hypothetical protein